MKLSVIIPCLNERPELLATIASIRHTTDPADVEVIVVDDASQIPITLADGDTQTILLRNPDRAGAGAARHIGAIAATGEYLLFIDSHARFEPGWFATAWTRIHDRRKTVHCARCVSVLSGMQPDPPTFSGMPYYCGATLQFFGPSPNPPHTAQALEGIWARELPHDDYPLSCLMGACYFWPRGWFLHLGGLRVLRGWGSEEPLSAIKCWRAGGDIVMLKGVRIGHIFRDASPYRTPTWQPIYNKLAVIHTCIPEPERTILERKLKSISPATEYSQARQAIEANANEILVERAHNQRIFVRSFAWYLAKFNLFFPAS